MWNWLYLFSTEWQWPEIEYFNQNTASWFLFHYLYENINKSPDCYLALAVLQPVIENQYLKNFFASMRNFPSQLPFNLCSFESWKTALFVGDKLTNPHVGTRTPGKLLLKICDKGSYIYYVSTFRALPDPLPPLISKSKHWADPLPLLKCLRNICMTPYYCSQLRIKKSFVLQLYKIYFVYIPAIYTRKLKCI